MPTHLTRFLTNFPKYAEVEAVYLDLGEVAGVLLQPEDDYFQSAHITITLRSGKDYRVTYSGVNLALLRDACLID